MGLQNKDEHNIILRSKIVFLHEFKQAIFRAIAKQFKITRKNVILLKRDLIIRTHPEYFHKQLVYCTLQV